MVRTSSFPGGSSPTLPGTPITGAHAAGLNSQRFEIQDDDLDELADSIPCSSPYFTQPTQIVNRTTQPTQIVEKRTTLQRSSPPVPETPTSTTTVEVPASSPFQNQSYSRPSSSYNAASNLAQRPAVQMERPGFKTGSKVASLMAPAGTAFCTPFAPQPHRHQPSVKQPLLSDDDMVNDYKHRDSSDAETSMRGDIRPTSFMKKQPTSVARPGSVARPSSVSSPKPTLYTRDEADISIGSIMEIRLRYQTKAAYKAVSKLKPDISVLACKNAVLKMNNSADDAIKYLLDESGIGPQHFITSKASSLGPTTIDKSGGRQTNLISRQNSLTDLSSPPASPYSPVVSKPPPKRRLIQGRRMPSPTPPPVFSVSSSRSSPGTSPPSSAGISQRRPTKMAVAATLRPGADSQSQYVVVPRRRLQCGSRPGAAKPPGEVRAVDLTVSSDSEDEFPALSAMNSRKRKAQSLDDTPVAAKSNAPIELSDDVDDGPAEFTESDSGSDSQSRQSNFEGEQESVIRYLDSCTAEELAKMAGLPVADAQLVISERPFADLDAVSKVSRKKQQSKNKSSKIQIGLTIVEKLSAWFKAFNAAATVIKKCEQRGTEIQAILSTWGMDRNGRVADGVRPRLPISVKPSLMDKSVQLKTYQLFGINWLKTLHDRQYSGILADDMGLGKTCQVIAFVCHLVENHNDGPYLIVVPPSVFENWITEFEKFAPDISVFLYHGGNRSDLSTENARGHHVVLTSYSQIEKRKEDRLWLQELDPHASIWDEGHKFKNLNTQTYQNLSRLPSEWRLVLSGTPVQNNLKELLSLLNFVEPDLFRNGDLERLRTIFEAKVPNKDVHNFAALARERVGNARTIIAPFILQRRKDDVLDLPAKIETRILLPMHPEQMDIYTEIKGGYLEESEKASRSKAKKTASTNNPWMQLRKAAIHHQLFRRHFTDEIIAKMTDVLWKRCSAEELDVQSKEPRHKVMFQTDLTTRSDFELHLLCKDFEKYIGKYDVPYRSWEDSPKVQKLLELVKGYQANGDRCLVFSRFAMVINILSETMHHADIPYCQLTGALSTGKRFPEVELYNKNPQIPVFLLTTGAGGTGLNLTSANKIIIFDMSDNPQDDVQASNRAHRIGQTREVEIIRFVTEKSVEVLVYNSCVKKLMLAACVEGQMDDNEESVEQECRRKMLMDTDAEAHEEICGPELTVPVRA